MQTQGLLAQWIQCISDFLIGSIEQVELHNCTLDPMGSLDRMSTTSVLCLRSLYQFFHDDQFPVFRL